MQLQCQEVIERGDARGCAVEISFLCKVHEVAEGWVIHEHQVEWIPFLSLDELRKSAGLLNNFQTSSAQFGEPFLAIGLANQEIDVERRTSMPMGRDGISPNEEELKGRSAIGQFDEIDQFHSGASLPNRLRR